MTRTVITFAPQGKSVLVTLERAPIVFESDSTRINLQSLTGSTLIDRGKSLLKMLVRRDPIKAGLTAALSLPDGASPSPLYFHVRAAAADALPWEGIYQSPQGFCALDARWPVGRIADRISTVRARAFQPPLRIVAVISAAGRAGEPQLQAILDAVNNAPISVRLHVISGDEAVVGAATGPGVTAEFIAGTSAELCQQITAAKPHVLHLLCHGGVVAGVRTLRFATVADFDAERTDFGSLRVAAPELVSALEACDPWLVVLSACQTAEAEVPNGRALAHDMVSAGVTAVIGMRRLVDLTNTDRFCRALYPEILGAIVEAVKPSPGGQAPGERILDWASALTNPRNVISGNDPSVDDTWLDPVLYVQNDDLRVFPPSQILSPDDYAELRGKLDQFTQYLATLDPATTHPKVISDVRDLIADTEAILRGAGVDVKNPAEPPSSATH